MNISFSKIKNIKPNKVDYTYDFQVQNKHRIICRQTGSKNAFYTSNCHHPDVKDFITAKQKSNALSKFNLSVLITDKFMHAVQNDLDWQLKFPDTDFEKYKEQWDGNFQLWEQKGYPFVVYETIKARELWDLIMLSTYTRNEPGVLFADTINRLNPVSYCQYICTTNPCGQIPQPSNVCNLGNINLVKFFNKETKTFNTEKFIQVIHTAVRFLDNICDISPVPVQKYKKQIEYKRRIGLGVLGLGSLLYMMKLRFGSKQAVQFVSSIFKTKAFQQIYESANLGVIRGSFKAFDKQKYFNTEYWNMLQIDDISKNVIKDIGCMRNSVQSTVPPSGNSSCFAGLVSGGIEPVFMKEYTRWTIVNYEQKQKLFKRHRQIEVERLNEWKKRNPRKLVSFGFTDIPDPHYGEWYQTPIFKFSKRGSDEILEGTIDGVDYQIEKNRGLIKAVNIQDYGWKYVKEHYSDAYDNDYIVQTHQLSVQQHIDMLEASARYINQNQSKTINIPENYSFEQFKNVYYDAWNRNIKGITTYRAGTMAAVLQQQKKVQQYQSQLQKLFVQSNGHVIKQDVKIPKEWQARGYTLKDKNGKKWYVSVAFADKAHMKPFALFIRSNNKQTTQVADTVITAMETLCRTKGISEQIIQKQRQKYSSASNIDKIARAIGLALRHNVPIVDIVSTLEEYNDGLSTLLFHIRKLLSKFIKDGTVIKQKKCQVCGGELRYTEGCSTCIACGNSRCG